MELDALRPFKTWRSVLLVALILTSTEEQRALLCEQYEDLEESDRTETLLDALAARLPDLLPTVDMGSRGARQALCAAFLSPSQARAWFLKSRALS